MPSLAPRHRRLSAGVVRAATIQLAALIAVGAIGATTLTATGSPPKQPVAAQVQSRPSPQAVGDRASEALTRPLAVKPAAPRLKARTAPRPPRRVVRRAKHGHPRRWLPTGTGMWIYQWNKTDHGRTASIVARAKRTGITTLFVRTGSTHDGFTGAGVLRKLLPATRGSRIKVVAWDFPELQHPERDAKRLARTLRIRAGGMRVAAVAPDIETSAEGTSSSAARVKRYLVALRRALPPYVAILATVPWPSRYRVGRFPYGTVAARSDALLPMAYWYDNSPVKVTAASMRYLRRFHRPVMPVGQGYDGRIDVPSLPHNDLRRQVPAFFRTAHRLGAHAVSLWSWQTAPAVTWRALAAARRLFPARR